uniref:IS66 family transposase n=1 Tax=Lysinibacillus mangiferihumi TaxID=1130819 RepID=UPI001F1AA628|nr:transposase [Lysinibacillus mangiferihumi]
MNDLGNVSTNDKVIELFEEQLTYMKKQNEELSIKLDQSLSQNKALAEQIRQLTKALYGSKSEKSKYQAPDGQGSLFDDDPSFNESEHTEEQSTATITYTVNRKLHKKKRNDSFHEGIEIEEVHHHPTNTQCDCCLSQMTEAGKTIAREEAKFIPAKMMCIQHIEHAYECKYCKMDATQKAQMKRGKAPQAAIQRSIAGPTVLAKLIYDKFIQYLPLYRQVKEWERYGLLTNDKNLSNWVIRAAEDWLLPVYEQMKQTLTAKSVLHVDETYAQIIKRSDGKSGQSNAYNWVFRSVPSQGPIIVLFQSALSRSRSVLEEFTEDFKGTLICEPIIEKFLKWVDESPFFGKNALAKAAEYTLNRVHGLKAFLFDGRIEIDNNPAENAIRPNVIGRKNWLFSVSEAGAKANAICLSLAETAKANGIDFYQYLVTLMTELPNLPIHQQPEILNNYMPWSKKIQATCVN